MSRIVSILLRVVVGLLLIAGTGAAAGPSNIVKATFFWSGDQPPPGTVVTVTAKTAVGKKIAEWSNVRINAMRGSQDAAPADATLTVADCHGFTVAVTAVSGQGWHASVSAVLRFSGGEEVFGGRQKDEFKTNVPEQFQELQ